MKIKNCNKSKYLKLMSKLINPSYLYLALYSYKNFKRYLYKFGMARIFVIILCLVWVHLLFINNTI